MIGIYKITSPSNKIYVGQSTDLKLRLKRYKYVLPTKQTKLYHSILKYGVDNHVFEIIEECDIEKLNERERFWQDFYNCLKEGLNCRLTETIDLSGYLSEEVKLKLSLAKLGKPMKEEIRRKISASTKGKPKSEEAKINMKIAQQNKAYRHTQDTLSKISKSKIGKKGIDANNIKPIIDLSTNIEYVSIQEASEKLNINYSKLYYYVRQGKKFKYIQQNL